MTLSSMLLVDKRIQDYETIVGAIKPDGVQAIVFDVAEIDAQCADNGSSSSSSSFQYILDKIAELGATSFSNIGIVQHNTGAPFHRFFAESQGEVSTVAGVETADPTLQTWAGFAAFVTTLKNTYGVQNVDLMACALYSDPNWKYVIDTLAAQTGTTVRASTDDTGAAALGGDWFLESHTGVNLKDVYFTEAIENFRGVLIYSTKQDTRSLFSTKSMAVGKATAWGATNSGGGTDVNTITGGVITSGVVALYSNNGVFAALKTNGSVSTWGSNSSGGNQTVGGTSPSVDSSLNSGVVEIFTALHAMAALKNDGTVVTWGFGIYGGSSTSVVLTNVVDIFSSTYAFAALKSNGSLVTWGDADYGGNSSTASPNLNSGVVSVNMAFNAGAALKSDGRVITWPTSGTTGGNSSTVTSNISSNVVVVHTDYNYTFAALKNDGSVINWGNTTYGGNPAVLATSVTLTNIVTIHSTNSGAYAALNINGAVVTWGLNAYGGNSTGISLSSSVVKVYNNNFAIAALKFDGSVVTWGDSRYGGVSTSVASDLSSGVVAVYGNYYAFAALKSNGRVITWGDSASGGSSASVATDISAGIVGIYSTGSAFAALRNDGKLITWGNSANGGTSSSVSTDLSAGVVSVNNTPNAFAAITSSATTFDLSMSYYRDIDRYNILRNKENRRRVNLTTLNNNVFTLSSARDVQKFNYTIPSGNSFRIIIPDYVSSNYSIISTATLPSDVSANYIIACDEGEPVTISGVTYINYGAFVYRRNLADNTFTKMTSTVIGGVTYNLYGGDGLFSSGIAFQYRFGAFAVAAKSFGDASFNITAPLTDSSGAFTFTSSNTGVATVTSGGTVTIVAAGTTTITATQAASGRFSSDSITASLVVNKAVSTLGALTVPAKLTSEAPFTLTTPTSTVSSIISPVNTITSTVSVIVQPPIEISAVSFSNSWTQRGADIDGEASNNWSGYSVSTSADGTVVAIGAPINDGTVASSDVGHVRVYAWNGTSWVQRGADIDGEAAADQSGWSVSMSADGTVVAIGAPKNSLTAGHVRVYTWNGTSWVRRGADIDGEASNNWSGYSVSMSADGTVVAIGAIYNSSNAGHVRVYTWNGTSWVQRGADIDGEAANDQSGWSVSMSADGTVVAIGAITNDGTSGNVEDNRGHVRVYTWNGSSWVQRGLDIDGEAAGDRSGIGVSLSADGTIVAIGAYNNDGTVADSNRGNVRIYVWNGTSWVQRGLDIDGEATNDISGRGVSLSADGTTVAIGAESNMSGAGHVRVYRVTTITNAITYTSSSSSIADVCGNLLLIKGVNGTSTITATQNGNTYTGRLDVSGTTYTLQYNPITYTIDSTSVGSVSTYGTVTLTGAIGTSTITATQPETLNYASRSVTGTLDVSGIVTVLGALTIPTKAFGDASFNLTAPSTNNPSGAFTYTSSNTAVATVTTGGVVTIIGMGTTTITATQARSGIYAAADVSGSLIVNFGNTNTITRVITDGASVIPAPVSNVATTYGSTWNQLGANIVGKVAGDESGTSISASADGTIVAIGARSNTTNRGTVRVYRYSDVSWNQIGADINGEASSDYSGQSVSLSANGLVLAIGANMNDGSGNLLPDSGHVRIYEFNGTNWVQRGGDIDGEANGDQSGISVSLSEDGNIVAIGAIMNDGSGNALSNSGHVRVYKYNASKTSPQLTNQSLSTFGPAGWDRLGADIDGEAVNDQSGFSVSLSADGATLAIGANFNDGTSGTVDTSNNRGHVRVYRYNASKTDPQLTNQSLTTFGPVGWDRLGSDIDGEVAADQSGFSVSLSADGSAVAIGSPLYDVSGVSNSGRVRVFAWNGTSWAQRGGNINGVNLNENIGDSVSLSADGNILSVSSFMKVVNYNYNSSTNTWSQIGANVTGAASAASNITNASLYSPHVYLDATTTSSYNSSTNTWTNIGSLGGNVMMAYMGTFDATDNGGSFNFNGSSNRGELAIPSTTLTSVTYVALVKTTGLTTGFATIIEFGLDVLLFATQTNILRMYTPSATSGFTLTAGVWYVVAVTITSGGTITFYVNGVSVYTTTGASFNTTNTTYGIGGGISGNEYWNGKISALAIYHNRVLTASEIANISNTFQTYRVSLSSQGNILAVGAREYDGTTGSSTNIGVARVYRIDTSGNYTYSSSNTAIADVCGNIILPKSAGSTTIAFTQSASGATASRSGTIPLTISGTTPTLGAFTVPLKNFGDASFNLTAPTSDSSGAFIYSSDASNVAIVTSDGVVTIVGVGTVTITATQTGSGNYNTVFITAPLVVSASLSNFTVSPKIFGNVPFDLDDPTSTDTTVGFTFSSSNTNVATIGGAGGRTVTIVGAGSSVITATQAATANRGQLDISATLVVSPARPVITLAPITKTYGNASFRPVPTTTNTDTSGGSVFTFMSDNIAVVSMLDASLVRINGVGTATLSITQAASANFTDSSGSVVVTVNKGVSGFSASTFTIPTNKTYGDAAFAITTKPISSSTGAITYSSSDEAVATVSNDGSGNSAITLVGQGTVTFTASQAESALYTADTKTSNTLTVARKTVALSRDTPSADTISKSYGDAAFTVIATNESNGAFSFASSDPSFATVDASTGEITIVAVGSTTLTATRAQTAQYAETSVSWTLNIVRGTTTLTGLSSLTRNVTVAPFSVTATSASNGAVSYALQDPSSNVLTIHPTSGLITLFTPGSAVIVASQGQGTLYEAPTSITVTITVSEAANTLEGATLTGSNNYANVDLSGGSLANANITNTNFSSGRLDNSNFDGSTISGANMSSSELSRSSFNNATVSNTNFTSARLNNANINNATITNSNMTSANLSGATMRGSTITGTDFTSAILRQTDLSGANVRGSIFNSADLSGAILTRMDASGASFINADLRGANLSNADFTNANMTNANISGADITNVTFTVPQKLQLLKNRANRSRSEIQVSQVLGSVLLPILSAGSAVRDIPNVANATFKVMLPSTSLMSSETILDIILDVSNFAYFYFPIGENEYFQIQGVKYYISGSAVRNYATGDAVENTSYGIKAIRLLAGSLTIIVNSQNTLYSSSFVVPSIKQNTDASFLPTTLPTSNSSAPIVYSSSNTSIATINSSSGVITPVVDAGGFVRFTASQAATETHESASITSNELLVNKRVDFTLTGLNQVFTLSSLATLDASSINVESTDATAVFYVRLSDMTNLFQYQTDSFDVNNLDASDVKYYVFHRTMPTELHFNPSHAMMNKTESAGMLGSGVQEISADKSLVKHDFIRYIALRLFNTYHGVDLFQNENDLRENITYLGETVQQNIDTILAGISTTSANETMMYDASGNKYLTNDASGNTNLCRELMRQVAAAEPSRFYNNGADTAASGVRNVPLRVDDSINFKLTITSAPEQNILTGVTVIPSRTYLIKMLLKNTVNTTTNDTNTPVTDSEMYPNSYPYSTSVTTYAPTTDSSNVYNIYSPPAPIPTSRFGYNGWYYANTSAWVNIAPAVRDRVKWLLPSNAAGSSTVADLRYIRMNLKVYNKTSLPFIVVTTQSGSYRKYTISAPNSLANGTIYSLYMNFNSYAREPAIIGATNAALTYSGVSNGSFDNGEVVASIAVETDNAAATSSVEFTLSSVIVGEVGGEKAYGFSSNV